MKRKLISVLLALLLLTGCTEKRQVADIAATTLPVYEFTLQLCEGTGLTVTRLVTENVSCLHDYSLQVSQVKAAEAAHILVLSGAGLEDFMADVTGKAETVIDASSGISLPECEEEHGHEGHPHSVDPHIWLDPALASQMTENICLGLSREYPQYADTFRTNLAQLQEELAQLQAYGEEKLASLSCREMITFHDGFSYFASAFDLTILEAVEEESGSEASARELIHLIGLVKDHSLPAVFTETNGSVSAAGILAAETGANTYALDMAMSGSGYFAVMYRNIDTIKEALG